MQNKNEYILGLFQKYGYVYFMAATGILAAGDRINMQMESLGGKKLTTVIDQQASESVTGMQIHRVPGVQPGFLHFLQAEPGQIYGVFH